MRTLLPLCLLLLLAGCGQQPSTPLEQALSRDDVNRIREMLPPGQISPYLIPAARWGAWRVIEFLVDRGADPNVRGGNHNWTAVMHAIHQGQQHAVEVLLAKGADPNATGGPDGATPLIMAAGYGYSRIVQALVEHGARTDATTKDGTDALGAALAGVPDLDRFTVGRCQIDTVRALLEADGGLRARLDKQSSGLRVARMARCTEVLELLDVKPPHE